MSLAELPTRRVEAWKYSDLRAVLGDASPALRDGRDIIERLAPETIVTGLAAGERKTVIERLEGGQGLTAHASMFDVGAGATLTRIVLQDGEGVALSTARVRLASGARLRQFVFSAGAKLARIETHVDANGEAAEVELNGMYLAGPGRHADLTSVITHAAKAGVTRQLIKGVAQAGGRGVFQGKIVVEPDAQRTDARQHHQGMLLAAGAEIFAKPELMIHADDVQCAHGNTAGGIDQNALFYLRSRGVPDIEARALLVEAFLLEAAPVELPAEIADEVQARVAAWLRGALA